jgi:hypothetical protein
VQRNVEMGGPPLFFRSLYGSLAPLNAEFVADVEYCFVV